MLNQTREAYLSLILMIVSILEDRQTLRLDREKSMMYIHTYSMSVIRLFFILLTGENP